MKKIIFIAPVIFALSGFGQNQIQTNVANTNIVQQRFVQVNQIFASNIMANNNNINKPVRANANPQVYVQRATNATGNQRQQRRRVINNVGSNNSNITQPLVNVLENNTDEIQQLVNFSQQADNNVGNAPDSYRDGNGSMIEQLASANIPAIQLGSGSLNLDINLPKINLPSIKFPSRKNVSNSKHKSFHFKNKLAKLNRKMTGKLSFGKKLKIKVDNCFKW